MKKEVVYDVRDYSCDGRGRGYSLLCTRPTKESAIKLAKFIERDIRIVRVVMVPDKQVWP